MKVRLYYRQITRLNQWWFFFGDWYSMERFSPTFHTKNEIEKYAKDNNIDYNNDEMMTIFV